ncbi:ribonuclease E inhibitor RraB [Xanthomonas sp. XNM01]|jgi:hypothetical protein|uniref:ribonuclease E inhibitor RraB n=1 Tax=Xanthomonas sp. XNM01 TaxID=2769289 RepID=UPI001785EA61|nr:ribonuclease E inhibitor RraB [Xanthomonas sp. XNM01]MBD9367668.1 ribonuclease E inhibitor RraB [Xanthomonas sp. XNM01]
MAIDMSSVDQMFADIRDQTDWNIDGPMRWGYFFADPDPHRLKRLGDHLVQDGYRQVDIFTIESDGSAVTLDAGDEAMYFLHVERIEAHTTWSLELRNRSFEALARTFEVAAYDGMDVGPATDPETDETDD